MTPDGFRRMALGLPDAVENSHMGHPDFRVRGKIFATLQSPDASWGVVKLSPELQEFFVYSDPKAYVPANGAWGRRGWTKVHLKSVKKMSLRDSLDAAWRSVAPKSLLVQRDAAGPSLD